MLKKQTLSLISLFISLFIYQSISLSLPLSVYLSLVLFFLIHYTFISHLNQTGQNVNLSIYFFTDGKFPLLSGKFTLFFCLYLSFAFIPLFFISMKFYRVVNSSTGQFLLYKITLTVREMICNGG